MRIAIAMLVILGVAVPMASAGDDTGDRVLNGVLNGLLGPTQPSPDQTYTAQQRDRLVSMLQSGEYVTSRQGEPVDMMVFGVPLTHASHVYSARPIPPTQMNSNRQ